MGVAIAVATAVLALAPAASASIGITSFDGGAFDLAGDPVTQAGSAPDIASTDFYFTTMIRPDGLEYATETLKDVVVDLPPGLLGNPQAVPVCPRAEIAQSFGQGDGKVSCPDSQVGFITLWQNGFAGTPGNPSPNSIPLYNVEAPKGTAALLGFNFVGAEVFISAGVRSGGDYGVTTKSLGAIQTLQLAGVEVTIWGIPADPSHDADRGVNDTANTYCADVPDPTCTNPTSGSAPLKPFFILPTSCITGPVRTDLAIKTWEGGAASSSFLSHDNFGTPIGNDGCNTLDFSPTLEARPTTNVADSPSGLDVTLHIPQNDSCDPGPPVSCDTAEAHLRDTVVILPKGLNVNPASANGLDGCSASEIGLTSAPGTAPITYTPDPANCPDASKLGVVEVETPLLDHPVPGAVYIATPYDNPFGSLLAIYIALRDPESGVVAKIAGEVHADPVTGQLTTTVDDNPQLPFEDFRLKFFGGAGGSLRTPAACGTYSTTSSLTPWSAPDSGPPATPSDIWAIEQGPGGSCASSEAQLPNAPSFDAGTIAPIAGAKTPLVVNLRRNDGSQNFSALNLSPPAGLVGKLAGIPSCPRSALDAAAAKSGKAEEASPSCPQASYVGSVIASAGAGPAPYHAPGKAYLTGPYKGAPLSLAIITPATAGPFDLGTVVVRTALFVNRTTAQISAVSDPIPHILQGIPLDVRAIQVKMDRPDFIQNPTNCNPSSFTGQLVSTLGQTAPLQSRFQVGECGQLSFKPQLSLNLKGSTKRTGHPALSATLTMPRGGANLAAISVALPHSEFLDQSHIGTICTRVQFAADQCPAASIYGTATATTPLLDYPLTGNVYLRSSSNPLPNLVVDLRGPAHQPIEIEADGRVDSVKGGIRNSFDFVPDAPVSSFTLQMQGGKKGLLENSTNLCRKAQRATVRYTAQNGVILEAKPLLKAQCSKRGKKKGKRGSGQRGHRSHE